jgi:acetoin utilization protein AcuB
MNNTNPIKDYMTESPHTIGEDMPLSKAVEMMREYRIRHLPVQHRGKLVGILSERDVHLALSVHPTAKVLQVGDVMTEEPYSVTPDCSLEQVATEMAKHKYGCAIVENEKGRAIGVFSATDAVGLLGELLRKKAERNPNIRLISGA